MTAKTLRATIVRDGSMCFIPLTFDPKAVFGRVRAPVKVTLNGHTYRSTIATMGGPPCIPLRKTNREAGGLEGGETIEVRLELDTEPRIVSRLRILFEHSGRRPVRGTAGRSSATLISGNFFLCHLVLSINSFQNE